jgi:hypothetical protein
MKYKTIILASLILNVFLIRLAMASPLIISFTPPPATAAGLVQNYGVYYQATNEPDPNCWHYLAQCPAGYTNIYSDTSLILKNPVFLSMTTVGRSGYETWHSAPFLFNTNNQPTPQAKLSSRSTGFSKSGPAAPVGLADILAFPQTSIASAPEIQGVQALAGGALKLTGIGSTNTIYRVWACTNLNAPAWAPIGSTVGDGTHLAFVDPAAALYPQRFYRLSLP